MKRRFRSFFALLLILLTVSALTVNRVSAATLRSKKIVSIVYDDSGSMKGANWAYANYSIQTFVAMLNEEDELYITYMSKPGTAVKIDTGDLMAAVNGIRTHWSTNNTPYESVTTAMKQLEKVSDNNPNTQYWLVVFTDGDFNDESNRNVSDALDKFKSKKMANGSAPQIMYMTIGDSGDIFTPHPTDKDITVIRAQREEDIRDSLFDIASRVTGRVHVEGRDISVLDDKTIEFSANVPLFSISILVQNKKVSVESIKDSDAVNVPIIHEIPLRMPDTSISGAVGVQDMFGSVILAGKEQGNIPAGNYTITFSDAISKDDIVIMLEPALQLKIKLYIGGKEVTDLDEINLLTTGLSAKAAIYEYGTDNEILESLLPGKTDKKMTFSIDGGIIDSNDALHLDNITVGEGENTVSASLDVSGYFHLETHVDLYPKAVPKIDRIDAEVSGDGSPRRKNSDGSYDADNVVYISRLKTNRTGIRFTVYIDGEPINHAMAVSMEKIFRSGLQPDFSNYEVEIQSDGSFLVYPNQKPWFMPIELYYLRHHGTQRVGIDLDGIHAEEALEFKMFGSRKEGVIHYIDLILLLYALYLIFLKRHFPKCSLVVASGRNSGRRVTYREMERVDLNWMGCFGQTNIFTILFNLIKLLLPGPSRTRFHGYVFSGQLSVLNRNYSLLVKNVRGKFVDTDSPRPTEESQETTIEMQDNLFIRDGESYIKFYIEN